MTTKHDLSDLLFYPFQQGAIAPLNEDSMVLVCDAVPVLGLQEFKNIDVVQSFKPDAQNWQEQGYEVIHTLEGKAKYDAVFCVLPQQKQAAYYKLAQALSVLKQGGILVVVAANDAGGKQIESKFKQFGLSSHNLSKNKCRIVWAKKENIDFDTIEEHIQNGAMQETKIEGDTYTTQAGIYGWNKIDKGSKLLIDNLPDGLKNTGADFGCGYGFLSSQILKKYSDIEMFYALEADYNALQCARENLKIYSNVQYDWVDLTATSKVKNLDWIVMNPPFHEGKKADSSIGQKFIETAHQSLSLKGMLYMVANIHLPYEKTLNYLFSNVDKIMEKDGYKILFAQK